MARTTRSLLALLAVAYALLTLAVLLLRAADVEVLDLFRDPTELSPLLGDHPWKGGLSMVGVVMWVAAATVCLFAGAALRARAGRSRKSTFLLATGVLLLVLGFDDAFVVHEGLAPIVTGTDRAEPLVLLTIAAAIAVWLVLFRSEIAASAYVILVLAFVGLGSSLLLDFAYELGGNFSGRGLIEETAELAGQLTFLVYAAHVAWRALLDPAGPAISSQPRRY
ncbi:MAG TPA: hypothetical protein VGU26_10715 [Gaiellaceae bacterium]|nr:hypothetical protein [Gaiellaceae bacterium]